MAMRTFSDPSCTERMQPTARGRTSAGMRCLNWGRGELDRFIGRGSLRRMWHTVVTRPACLNYLIRLRFLRGRRFSEHWCPGKAKRHQATGAKSLILNDMTPLHKAHVSPFVSAIQPVSPCPRCRFADNIRCVKRRPMRR